MVQRSEKVGLNNDAIVPLSPEQVEWADVIFVMEKEHRNKLNRKFKRHLNGQRVIVLGIPDDYDFMDPEARRQFQELMAMLQQQVMQSTFQGMQQALLSFWVFRRVKGVVSDVV